MHLINVFALIILTTCICLLPINTTHAQDMRRVFQHRGVWVDNIGACPSEMTDRLIDYFQGEGFELRQINVNPFTTDAPKDCRDESLFLVYLRARGTLFTYPGYTRYIERSGRFLLHSEGEVEDLPFNLEDPLLRVVEVTRRSTYMTELNSHGVKLQDGARISKRDMENIVEEVHAAYGPGIKRRIAGPLRLRRDRDGMVTVSFTGGNDRPVWYRLRKNKERWTVIGTSETRNPAQMPLPGR